MLSSCWDGHDLVHRLCVDDIRMANPTSAAIGLVKMRLLQRPYRHINLHFRWILLFCKTATTVSGKLFFSQFDNNTRHNLDADYIKIKCKKHVDLFRRHCSFFFGALECWFVTF